VGGMGAVPAAGAEGGAAAYAAAGQDDRVHRRPVLAAAPFVDLWRAAELAEPYDQGLVQQAALGQVLQKHCVTPVLDRQDAVLEKLEVVPVRVPGQRQTPGKAIETNRVDIDERDTGLDESAGQKAALAEDCVRSDRAAARLPALAAVPGGWLTR